MLRLLLPGIIALGVGACATTAATKAPTAPSTPATTSANSASADATNGVRGTPVNAEAESSAAATGKPADVITVAEVPQVMAAEAAAPAPPKKICQRVKPTGSHRYRRVCYTASEVAESTDDARQVFGELHRQQQVPNGK